MKKAVLNEIIDVICNVWEKNIARDYNKGMLLEEDTLKCAFYYHLRRKLGKLMEENNLCIFTEYQVSEFKGLKYRPDMVIVEMKDAFDDEYLINNVKKTVVAIEFKYKGKYETESIFKDRNKIKDYIEQIDDDCQYVMAIIQEKYWKDPYWFGKSQTDNWAKGRVVELVASYEDEACEKMKFYEPKRY